MLPNLTRMLFAIALAMLCWSGASAQRQNLTVAQVEGFLKA